MSSNRRWPWVPDPLRAICRRAVTWYAARRDPSLATTGDLKACYRVLLGRQPDLHGLHTFVPRVVRQGIPLDELVGHFVSSPEFKERLGRLRANSDSSLTLVPLDDGFSVYVRQGDTTVGKALRAEHHYEPHVAKCLREFLGPGGTFVDVGASVGYFTVLGGHIVGDTGKVISFEPGPQNVPLLLLNIAANGLGNVDVHQLAVTRYKDVLLYSRSGGNGTIRPWDRTPKDLDDNDLVQGNTLDRVLGPTATVDVIKVDVEGAEGLVLRGAEQVLRHSHPAIIFEFSPPSLEVTSKEPAQDVLQCGMLYVRLSSSTSSATG